MTTTIQMDTAGRVVLPKTLRDLLNLRQKSSLRAEVVAGRIELTPVADVSAMALTRKKGIVVLQKTGVKVNAAAAVAGERGAQEERGLKR